MEKNQSTEGEKRGVAGGDHQQLLRSAGTVLVLPPAGCVSWGKPLTFSVLHLPFCSEGNHELMAVEGLVRQQRERNEDEQKQQQERQWREAGRGQCGHPAEAAGWVLSPSHADNRMEVGQGEGLSAVSLSGL